MSKRSDSSLIVVVVLALAGVVFLVLKFLWGLFDRAVNSLSQQGTDNQRSERDKYLEEQENSKAEEKKQREEDARKRSEEERRREVERKRRFEELKKQVALSGEKDLIFNESIREPDKIKLFQECFNYSNSEALELLETAKKETKRARLQKAKKAISRKAFELYGGIPSDDKRESIPDEVKQYVWQRDKGQCVKCQAQENIEYDHIIPFSKGGSNTARNIQILCQDCNRSKNDSVV